MRIRIQGRSTALKLRLRFTHGVLVKDRSKQVLNRLFTDTDTMEFGDSAVFLAFNRGFWWKIWADSLHTSLRPRS